MIRENHRLIVCIGGHPLKPEMIAGMYRNEYACRSCMDRLKEADKKREKEKVGILKTIRAHFLLGKTK